MSNNEFDNFVEFKKKYKELINLVYKNSGEEKLNVFIENVSDEDLQLLINNFCKSIENDKKSRKLFLNRNERLFSETSKVRIIPSFNLKKCLSSSENSAYIWECIQLLYAIYRTGDESKKENVQNIVDAIEKFNLGENTINEDEDTEEENIEEIPRETKKVDNIVMDIADTLRNNMVKSSKGNAKVNPIENMLKTSQMISEKYGKKIKSGQISMNDMFDSLGRMMSEIDKKTSNDEELKKVDIEDMPNPEDMMSQLGVDMNGFNPMDILGSMLNKKNETEELTAEQIKEMEEFYANVKSEDLKGDDKSSQIESMNNSLMDKLPDDKKQQFMEMTKNLMSSISK